MNAVNARALAPLLAALGMLPAQPSQPAQLQRITRDRLCVTNGEITTTASGRLAINTPSSRALVRGPSTPAIAEIRFTYLGPSADSKPLASGEIRRQIGLKLRSQNQCNLLYVMWHIEPDHRVIVQTKQNPGESTHAQCGAHGYTTLRPDRSAALPPIASGASHTLRASLTDHHLIVTADNQVVW